MMAENNELIFFNPGFSHTIWGGNRLRTEFGYDEPGEDIGECWGISAHPTAESFVRDGVYQGLGLSELWKEKREIFGNHSEDKFPLLIKIIDAKADLSIQVHPDDTYAKAHENSPYGKTECWYILDCPDNASLVIGHNANTKEELDDLVLQKRWNEFIREVPVKKGDFIQIDPGTVHAIKGGFLILETQQSCDLTYRVYDYDRLSNGKPRELHIQKSLDVITVPARKAEDMIWNTNHCTANKLESLYSCCYYHVYKLNVNQKAIVENPLSFMLASVISGEGTANRQPIRKGDHFLIPADIRSLEITGNAELILSGVPNETAII